RVPSCGGAPRFRSGGRDAACRRRARAVGRAGASRSVADGSLASEGHTTIGLLAMDIRRVPRAPLIALALFALMALPSFVEFYVDWLWFGELGYRQVFWKSITTRAVLGSVTFVLAAAFLGANLFLALGTMPLRNIVVVTPEGPRTISLQPRRLRPVIYLVSGLAALLLAGLASSGWQAYLQFSQGVAFGHADPVLDRDIAFYMFR